MLVRKMEEKDIPAVAEFEKQIAVISFGDTAMMDPGFHEKKLKKAMSRDAEYMLVLEDDGTLKGWLWMAAQTNSVSNERYINFKSFLVQEHGGDPSYTETLMQAGMDYCKKTGARRIVGKTFAGNLPMRLVYKKFGFKPTHLTMEYTMDALEGADR